MSTIRPLDASRHARAALTRAAALTRLPAKPRLNTLDPSLWWVHTLRHTVWRWQRRQASRAAAPPVWC